MAATETSTRAAAQLDDLYRRHVGDVYRYTYAGIVTKPTGNSHPQLAPFDVYKTADGHCAIAAPTQNHWALLCAAIDRTDLIYDSRTLSNKDRVMNASFVKDVIATWTAGRTTAQIVDELGGSVPVGARSPSRPAAETSPRSSWSTRRAPGPARWAGGPGRRSSSW